MEKRTTMGVFKLWSLSPERFIKIFWRVISLKMIIITALFSVKNCFRLFTVSPLKMDQIEELPIQ